MRHWTILGVGAALAACAGPVRFAGPAPQGALACAVREAEELGYRRLEGGVEDGTVRLGLAPRPRREDERMERNERLGERVTTDFSDVALQGQMRVRQVRDQLRVEVLSEPRGERDAAPRQSVADHARAIVAQCTAPGGGAEARPAR